MKRRNRIVSSGLAPKREDAPGSADNEDVTGMRLPAFVCLLLASACLTGCASTGGVPEPFPRPGGRPARAPAPVPVATTGTHPPADGYSIAGTALALRGAPYRDGGADPRGFDCSGFVEYVFSQHGVAVPRTVTELYAAGAEVQPNDIQAGDLLFFSTTAPGPSHVAMAIGGDEFVHAPSTSGVVRVERLSGGYWGRRFLVAKRVIPNP
jgi:cell wall-associated NlpC family hydrolase